MKHIAYQHFHLGAAPWAAHQETADAVRVAMAVQAAVAAGAMVAIVGRRGLGKTHALWAAIDAVDCAVVTPLRLDRERLRIGDVLLAVVAQLSEETPRASAEARTGQARRLLRAARRPVLVIDEAHDLHPRTVRSLKRLRELVAGRGQRATLLPVILVGQSDPVERIAEVALRTDTMHLGGLTQEEAITALERLGDAIDAPARAELARSERARCWLELQTLTDECLAAAMAEGAERVTAGVVRRVLGRSAPPEDAAGPKAGPAVRPGAVAAVLGGVPRRAADSA